MQVDEQQLQELIGDEFDARLERIFAKFFVQMTQYIDKQLADFDYRMEQRFNQLEIALDHVAKRMEKATAERAAMNLQLNQHGVWIKKLATSTGTSLATP